MVVIEGIANLVAFFLNLVSHINISIFNNLKLKLVR